MLLNKLDLRVHSFVANERQLRFARLGDRLSIHRQLTRRSIVKQLIRIVRVGFDKITELINVAAVRLTNVLFKAHLESKNGNFEIEDIARDENR